jgi:hypothetical protein
MEHKVFNWHKLMQDILDFKFIKHNASPLSIPSSLTPDYVHNPLSLKGV